MTMVCNKKVSVVNQNINSFKSSDTPTWDLVTEETLRFNEWIFNLTLNTQIILISFHSV